jgi:hypothetical protein
MVMTMEEVRMYGCDSLNYIDGNQKVFIQAFRELTDMGQKLDREDRLTGENLNKIQEAADVSEEPITMDQFVAAAKHLYLLGELPVKPEPVKEPEVERDKLGRPLSPKAKQWKRWEEFCNDPKTKMADINNLRRTDAKFAEFYKYQNNLRVNEEGVQDGVVAVGTATVRQDKSISITNDLRRFADEYRHTGSSDVRRLSSAALNPNGYQLYKMKLDECIAAGLL